jgi:hypothetical protein
VIWARPEEGGRALVWRTIALTVLDGVLPADPEAKSAALGRHMTRLNAAIEALSPATKAELGELLDILLTAPGRRAIAGVSVPWHLADHTEVAAGLESMRTSRLALRQQAFHALRDLTNAAYFSGEETWPTLGYPGPPNL